MTTTATNPPAIDTPSEPAPGAAPAEQAAPRERSRRRVFYIVGALLVLLLCGALAWWLMTRGKESTDDAEVQADVVPLAPRVGGRVERVLVVENQRVTKGQLVLEIDDADYAVRVRQDEANLTGAEAGIERARPQARLDERDLGRSQSLSSQGVGTRQDLERAQVTARTGQAGLVGAEASLAGAKAALEQARLQLSYTKVYAPADGYVSSLTAHPGQVLSADQPFAEFVPGRAYVVANFKETQIGGMRPGSRATVTIDAYGHRTLEARVESLSAGTGAEFSLLPPNNATGNFVKVVQRVPVRIELVNPPPDLPLRAGLSADVTVYGR
ncbi:MAG TPA: HlyD family secretion protein [Polyangiaceae bacterium]|jgi:membrane fusion protein (multidrug efflux system)